MGIVLAITGLVWHTQMLRKKGRELFFAGEKFPRAIGAYHDRSPGGKKWPDRLEDLLQDSRFPTTQRYLRRLYVDPMNGGADWGLMQGPEGEIVGVYSRSDETRSGKRTSGLATKIFPGCNTTATGNACLYPICPTIGLRDRERTRRSRGTSCNTS
jgi:hypothetical protein